MASKGARVSTDVRRPVIQGFVENFRRPVIRGKTELAPDPIREGLTPARPAMFQPYIYLHPQMAIEDRLGGKMAMPTHIAFISPGDMREDRTRGNIDRPETVSYQAFADMLALVSPDATFEGSGYR